jgi:hypothetical protein
VRSASLPPLPDVWARWALIASVLPLADHGDILWVDDDGAHHDDGGGNWSQLVRLADGRGVLFGYDHEYSDTTNPNPAVDLLADAPPWAPLAALVPAAEDDQLGYCYWWAESGWTRVDYDVADGLEASAPRVFDDAGTITEIREWLEPSGRDAPAEACGAAVEAARRRQLRVDHLEAVLGDAGPAALARAVERARSAGLTADGPAPPVTVPAPNPARRRRRRLTDDEADAAVTAAMRTAVERPRPDPGPSRELDRLVKWVRKKAGRRGSAELVVTATGRCDTARLRPQTDDTRDVLGLADAVRTVERDPSHGRWLWMRLRVDGRDAVAERVYDQWPSWYEGELGGPWQQGLADEMAARDPAWRPAWTGLLDGDAAWETVEL